MADLAISTQDLIKTYGRGTRGLAGLDLQVIAAGTRAVAGDEEAGTLELILAHPVSRRGLALRRLGAALTGWRCSRRCCSH
jgi:ABC-type transport system involved in multi-copper enzyme maturation permease subunit